MKQKRVPTTEQVEIVKADVPVLKVNAGAGTGKSTTLEMKAAASGGRALYVCFNKSIADEASAKFPSNVVCRTSHSLAFAAFGRRYTHKLQPSIRPYHIEALLFRSHREMPESVKNLYSGRVLEALSRFLVSGDPEIGNQHIVIGRAPAELKYFFADQVKRDVNLVWEAMKDPGNTDVPMLHDGYLKLYQLSNPRLQFDLILFDEAQDTNPVTQAIIESQHSRKIYVGDKDQAIYGFRGARNAMETVKADLTLPLMGSFRFGPEIAQVANAILSAKGDIDFPIRGLAGAGHVNFHDGKDIAAGTQAFLTRGNAALFHRAVANLKGRHKFGFVGDVKNYRFDLIQDAYNLKSGEYVKDPFIRSFGDYDSMAEYAEQMDDKEIKSRCRIVEKYGSSIPCFIRDISAAAIKDVACATPGIEFMTTAHKSKGLEFDTVTLGQDFPSFFDDNGDVIDIEKEPEFIEEINLQYVAATRAKQNLCITGEELAMYLEHVNNPGCNRKP